MYSIRNDKLKITPIKLKIKLYSNSNETCMILPYVFDCFALLVASQVVCRAGPIASSLLWRRHARAPA